MANQIVTESINLDDNAIAGALLHGESITILTGSTLTINSDNARGPLGKIIGDIFINDGTVIIDGTTVREINYSNATVLPSVRQYVSGTIGGTGGEIIRVIGSAATGTIKIRKLLGGTGNIAANEPLQIYNSTTSSIASTATASAEGDFVGTITIWGTTTRALNVSRLGTLIVTGSWIYLDSSSGNANQIVALPSGSYTGPCPAVWIETSQNSNVYEPWLNAGTQRWETAVAPDSRGKFFSQSAALGTVSGTWNNLIQFGSGDGDRSGSIPPLGARIRIPNIVITSQTTANFSSSIQQPQTTIGNNWELQTSSSGIVYMDTVSCPGFYINASQPFSIILKNVSTFRQLVISEAPQARLENCAVGIFNSQSTNPCVNFTTNQLLHITGGAYAINATTNNSWTHQFNTCNNVFVSGAKFISFAYGASSHYQTYLNICNNVTMSGVTHIGAGGQIVGSSNVLIESQSFENTTTGSNFVGFAQYAWQVTAGSQNITFNGFTSSYSLPRNEIYYAINSSNIKIRNLGDWNNRFWLAAHTNTVFNNAGNNIGVEISRVYISQSRVAAASLITTTNSNTKLLMQNNYYDNNDGYNQTTLNTRARGLRFGVGTLGSTSGITTALVAVYGNHFYDFFITDVSGGIGLHMCEGTSDSSTTGSYFVTTGSALFNSAGGLVLKNSQDEVEWTWPWYILGHTGFANQVSQSSGTNVNNLLFTYALDTGSGLFGAFKTASVSNLTAETIDPSGFKIKIRAKCINSNPANVLTGYILPTISTAAAQSSSLYPLEEKQASLILTGLVSGSEVRVYRKSDGLELAGAENASDPFTYTYIWAGSDIVVDIVIHALNYEYIRYSDISLGSTGLSIPIQQRFDRNYSG